MINALQAAKISRKAPNDCEVYWEKIQRTIEIEIESSAKYGNTFIEYYTEKHIVYIACMLQNLGFKIGYDRTDRDDGILKISWANKNIQAGNEIFDEEHICTCKYCKKEMK